MAKNKKSFWQKAKEFVHDIIYVSDDDDDETEEIETEESKEEQLEMIQQIQEEENETEFTEEVIYDDVVVPEETKAEPVVEERKPERPVVRESQFITLDRRPIADEKKEEQPAPVNKPVSNFKRVEIISPVGPSGRYSTNSNYELSEKPQEKSEYRPVVDIISINGYKQPEVTNDDVDQQVASLSIDDFTGYQPHYAAAQPAVQQPEEVKAEPVIEEKAPVEIERPFEQTGTIEVVNETVSAAREFEDVFHSPKEVTPVRTETVNSPDFNIPEYLNTDKSVRKKTESDGDVTYENLSLFDFMEEK